MRYRSAERRIGCYLLQLLEKRPPQLPVRLPLEKRQIAWHLGMTLVPAAVARRNKPEAEAPLPGSVYTRLGAFGSTCSRQFPSALPVARPSPLGRWKNPKSSRYPAAGKSDLAGTHVVSLVKTINYTVRASHCRIHHCVIRKLVRDASV